MRNRIVDTCDECGKEVEYEKDEGVGTSSVETAPFVWENLCEDCLENYYDRRKAEREE
jgi:hypothetical protein